MTRLPWGRASICWRASRGFPSQGRRPRWAHCGAGAPRRVGDTRVWPLQPPLQLLAIFHASRAQAGSAPRPARTSPFKVSEASSRRLSVDLPLCPLSPFPVIQAASGCLWMGYVCPWVSSSQPQFLSLSLQVSPCLYLSIFPYPPARVCLFLCLYISFSLFVSLSLCLFQSISLCVCPFLSVFPCLCLPCLQRSLLLSHVFS